MSFKKKDQERSPGKNGCHVVMIAENSEHRCGRDRISHKQKWRMWKEGRDYRKHSWGL